MVARKCNRLGGEDVLIINRSFVNPVRTKESRSISSDFNYLRAVTTNPQTFILFTVHISLWHVLVLAELNFRHLSNCGQHNIKLVALDIAQLVCNAVSLAKYGKEAISGG